MLEFEKAFLKRGKELFEKNEKVEENDEEIDKDYKNFEECEIMGIKGKIQEREYRIKSKRDEIKRCEDRLKFEKIFQNFSKYKMNGKEYPNIYCVKEKRHTSNVPGSEKKVFTKNKRRLLKVKCVSCGITKTRFMPGN